MASSTGSGKGFNVGCWATDDSARSSVASSGEDGGGVRVLEDVSCDNESSVRGRLLGLGLSSSLDMVVEGQSVGGPHLVRDTDSGRVPASGSYAIQRDDL